MNIVYEGDLHCTLTHGPSGDVITTDAPIDNHGKGESFSPTDLMAASIGSCMMTVMAIAAQKQGIELKGTTIEVEKEMVTEPIRRIGRVTIKFNIAPGIDPAKQKLLETAALNCPVSKSLNTNVPVNVEFKYQ
jgi:putative redox protein